MRAFIVGGQLRESDESFDVRSPWDDSLVESVAVPRDSDIEDAAALAHTTFAESRLLPAHVRIDALTHISQRLDEQRDELATQIAREGGKPLKWARVEAARAVSTFRIAAEEVRRWGGDFLRLDTEASLGARAAIVRRFPIGPVLGIAPFNFPLNLVAHKVAPALAVGAPIVVKPATATPLSALSLAEIIAETELPKGMISVLPVSGARAEQLVRDRRFPKVSFTGSTDVGWRIKALEPRKRFTLELGGNAGVIVHSDADLDRASERIAFGGYYQAGQSCISVQRILVQSQVFDSFSTRLVKQVSGLVVGDPLDPATDVGPLIDTGALDRVESWVQEAESQG
ncbi:MAG TPA: aldehyde dehydrogenase family protein, partial [Actinomycetota bacterium]|nr:aldehyde dehydrogenase family protein [Actinomycetota bacterium]